MSRNRFKNAAEIVTDDAVTSGEQAAEILQEEVVEAADTAMASVAKEDTGNEEVIVEVMETGEERKTSFVTEIAPIVKRHTSKAIYKVVYYAAYGVVYTSLQVSRLIPAESLVARAVKDGAVDARNAVDRAEMVTGDAAEAVDSAFAA